jgi:soluble cytochrome b562
MAIAGVYAFFNEDDAMPQSFSRVRVPHSAFLLFLTSGPFLLAAAPPASSSPTTGPSSRPASIDIGDNMNEMKKALRSLQTALTDPPHPDAAFAALVELERNAILAKSGTPPRARDLLPEQRAKFMAAYHAHMNKLIRQLLDIEDLVAAAKYKEARDALTAVAQIEQEGHNQFSSPLMSY